MKNIQRYHQTKYKIQNGKIDPSLKKENLSPTSYLIAYRVAKIYEKYIPKYCKGSLLDLGCGNIPLYDAYKPYITNCTCADWSNSLHKNIHLDCICDLNQKLPFESNVFDTIILSDVIEHIFEPVELMKEVYRVLKPSGIVIINSPFMYLIHEAPYDFGRYTEYWYRRVAKELDFHICTLTSLGGPSDVLIDLFSKTVPFKKIMGWVQRRMAKRNTVSKSRNIHMGYFVILRKHEAKASKGEML